jgi:hypothetical protein
MMMSDFIGLYLTQKDFCQAKLPKFDPEKEKSKKNI